MKASNVPGIVVLLAVLLSIFLIVLKALGLFPFSWLWVFAPAMFAMAVFFIVLMIAVIATAVFSYNANRRRRKWLKDNMQN